MFSILVIVSGCGKKSDKIVLKLGHGLDVNHPVHKAMEFMAKRIEEESNGRVTMEIFPSEQLGSERELIEQVQIGCVDMTKSSTSPMESFVPVMGVFSVPYVFRSEDHAWRVCSGPIGKELLKRGESVGLKGLCYYDAGSRSFYTKDKAINSPADLKGMKIRVQQSKTSMEMVDTMGASPTPIAWGELYTALQQGVVDGAENNPPSFYTSRHYEVCKYYSLDEHTTVPDILLISYEVWKKFPEDVRRIIQKAADESAEHQRILWREMTLKSMKVVKDAGVKIIRPDKKLFSNKVREMHEGYNGTEVGDYIKRIKAAR